MKSINSFIVEKLKITNNIHTKDKSNLINEIYRKLLIDYLCENDYASNIQNGKFTLKSNMSYKEIAEIITSKPTED